VSTISLDHLLEKRNLLLSGRCGDEYSSEELQRRSIMHAQLIGKWDIMLDQPILDEFLCLGSLFKCWLLVILPSLKLLLNHLRTQLMDHITTVTI
jgi:hypothetical protein